MEWVPGTDWGSYLWYNRQVQFDWELLVAAGLKFCVHKGCQEQIDDINGHYSTVKNIEEARKRGVEFNASYYWHFPHLNQKLIMDSYKRAMDRENADFNGVDAEQMKYWDDATNSEKPVDPDKASDTFLELCDFVSNYQPEKQFVIYSRKNYIDTVLAKAKPHLNKYQSWTAAWPDYGMDVYPLLLQDLFAGKIKQVQSYNIKPYIWKWAIVGDDLGPGEMIVGSKTVMWQTSSRIIPIYDGKTQAAMHQYDWNFFMGNIREMRAWVKKTTAVPPQPTTADYKIWAPLITKWARGQGYDGPDPVVGG